MAGSAGHRDVEFRLLGPVEARCQGKAVDLGGSKPVGILAMLLLAANRPVSATALIDGLWADDPPRTVAKMIHIYVSRIRQQLGGGDSLIETVAGGYLIHADEDSLDLMRFEQLQHRFLSLADKSPGKAATILADGLALWRGPSLANVRAEPFAGAAAARLDEMRMTALEARIDADLAAGHHRSVVAELQELVGNHPTREHLGAQLMLALYRSGRQADALAAAHKLRTDLREELGISPSAAVSELEMSILRQEPTLQLAPRPIQGALPGTDAAVTGATGPTARLRRRTKWRAAAAVVVAAAVTGTAIVAVSRNRNGTALGDGHVSIAPHSLLLLDGSGAAAIADVHLGGHPNGVAAAGGSAWVTNDNLRTVSQVQLSGHKVTQTFGLPDSPSELAANSSEAWIGDAFTGKVTRFFSDSTDISAPFFPEGAHAGLVILAADEQNFYAGLPDGRLIALRTDNLRTSAVTPLADRVGTLVTFGSNLCAGSYRAPVVSCLRLPDFSTQATMLLPTRPIALAGAGSHVWALAGAPAQVWQLDLTNNEHVRIPIPPDATAIAASEQYLWVLYGSGGRLMRLPASGAGAAVTITLGHPASAIATWNNEVLVSLA